MRPLASQNEQEHEVNTHDHDFFTIWYSPIILVSGDITFIPKFEGGHPE